MNDAGFYVPDFFDKLPETISKVHAQPVEEGETTKTPAGETLQVPMDYARAKKLDMLRAPATFNSLIAYDRGEELGYDGVTTSDALDEDMGLDGGVPSFGSTGRPPKRA